jgi:hypothetical protein
MTLERPTVNDMQTIAANMFHEGQKSRAETLHNFIVKHKELLQNYAALEAAAREAKDGLSSLHALVVLNCKTVTVIEADEIVTAMKARDELARLLDGDK